jgi:hypothetical protein
MDREIMGRERSQLMKRLEQLCDEATRETDPQRRTQLTAEIFRLVEEKNELRPSPESPDNQGSRNP